MLVRLRIYGMYLYTTVYRWFYVLTPPTKELVYQIPRTHEYIKPMYNSTRTFIVSAKKILHYNSAQLFHFVILQVFNQSINQSRTHAQLPSS